MDINQLTALLGLMYPQAGNLLPVLSKLTASNQGTQPPAAHAGPAPVDGRIIYVQNETEAATYRVPAGEKIALWDSDKDVVYIKWADADGKQHLATADLSYRKPEDPDAKFVTREDFEAFKSEWPQQLQTVLQQYIPQKEA